MKLLVGICTGVGAIAFGFVIYPYYLDYVITPLIDLIEALFPSLNALESAYMDIVPFLTLTILLFCGVMYIIGKVPSGPSEPGEPREGE